MKREIKRCNSGGKTEYKIHPSAGIVVTRQPEGTRSLGVDPNGGDGTYKRRRGKAGWSGYKGPSMD